LEGLLEGLLKLQSFTKNLLPQKAGVARLNILLELRLHEGVPRDEHVVAILLDALGARWRKRGNLVHDEATILGIPEHLN